MEINHDKNQIRISDGEFVAVFHGTDLTPPRDFATHPQIQWIPADKSVVLDEAMAKVPAKTKVFILTQGVGHAIFAEVQRESSKRRALVLQKPTGGALKGTLANLFDDVKITPDAPPPDGRKNKLQWLFEQSPPDPSKTKAEEARRFLVLAKTHGIQTTHGALAQSLAQYMRKHSIGQVPASARPKDLKADALMALDDAVAACQLARAEIVRLVEENKQQRAYIDDFKKIAARLT